MRSTRHRVGRPGAAHNPPMIDTATEHREVPAGWEFSCCKWLGPRYCSPLALPGIHWNHHLFILICRFIHMYRTKDTSNNSASTGRLAARLATDWGGAMTRTRGSSLMSIPVRIVRRAQSSPWQSRVDSHIIDHRVVILWSSSHVPGNQGFGRGARLQFCASDLVLLFCCA